MVLGASGSGKSKFLSLLINQIYDNYLLKNNYKVVVIDPHYSLEKDIGGLGNVIDFKSAESSLNLFAQNTNDAFIAAELLLELFSSLFKDQYNIKLERVLRYSTYLLIVHNVFSFSNLKKLLLELDYRNELLKEVQNLPYAVINFFLSDFNDLKLQSYSEAIAPIISFIDEMDMNSIFSYSNSLSFKDSIKNNFLTLFSLDRLSLGDRSIKTIAGLVMEQLITLAQSQEITNNIILIIDEVAIVENPLLIKILAEARKYNLTAIIAGQYFNQISKDLKDSILANVSNYYLFRISRDDAAVLAENMNMKIVDNNSLDKKIDMLATLRNRECIMRLEKDGTILTAFKGNTLDLIVRAKKENKFFNRPFYTPQEKSSVATNFVIDKEVNFKDILK